MGTIETHFNESKMWGKIVLVKLTSSLLSQNRIFSFIFIVDTIIDIPIFPPIAYSHPAPTPVPFEKKVFENYVNIVAILSFA